MAVILALSRGQLEHLRPCLEIMGAGCGGTCLYSQQSEDRLETCTEDQLDIHVEILS